MSNQRAIGKLEISIEWNIADFLSLSAEVDKRYHSNDFHFADATWRLHIYPNGQSKYKSEGCIGLYLFRKDSGLAKCMTHDIFLKKLDGKKEDIFTKAFRVFESNNGWGIHKSIPRSRIIEEKADFLPSGVLTVVCVLKNATDDEEEIIAKEKNDEISTVAEESTQTDADDCVEKLRQELGELFISGQNSDLTLSVKDKEFAAHRCILAARSPVFSAMMEHEMKEKSSGVVTIEDSDLDTFSDFLHHLYTGRVENLTVEKSLHLYETADKYQVNELKNSCVKCLMNNVSVENFCDVMSLSLRHQERELTAVASKFFVENSLEVLLTCKWQVFLDENPTISNELLIKMVREKEKMSERC